MAEAKQPTLIDKALGGLSKSLEGMFTKKVDQKDLQAALRNMGVPRSYWGQSSGTYRHIGTWSFDGEKNFGEMGPIRDYYMAYEALRVRSWQSYIESEVTQTVINKHLLWAIGSGLKLQAEPSELVLLTEGIEFDKKQFERLVEARFKVYSDNPASDYAGMCSLSEIAVTAKKQAMIGGDVLVILRFNPKDKFVTTQLVDGHHVGQPVTMITGMFDYQLSNGNVVRNGIEMDPKGKHIAYYVREPGPTLSYKRVPAWSNGQRMAFMVYGSKHRIDDNRGLPLIACVLETLKKLERYKEATVGAAEERQKIPYFFEHSADSTGENPLAQNLAKALDPDGTSDLPSDDYAKELARNIAVTHNKMVYNLPPGAVAKMLESKNELYFKDFYTVNVEAVCAALLIPYEVAMSRYGNNYSASRGAMKDWEHTVQVDRDDFGRQFYQPHYKLWMLTEVLKGKIDAPGYLEAHIESEHMITGAYHQARFVGPPIPHIDPVKEVEAERKKLGPLGDHIPLTTVEQATERLHGGDPDSNVQQFSEEVKEAAKHGIKPPPPGTSGDF